VKKSIVVCCCLLLVCLVNGQRRNNTWYFGKRVGLDFNTSPPGVLTNSQILPFEGSAAISDNEGKLLFYTDGLKVYNRKHEVMPNGQGLSGDLSSTNNTVIIPSPVSNTIYYVFTIGGALQEDQAFSYSLVDISLNGGYGDVTQKNTLVETGTFEKLAAVSHCNSKYTWLVTRKWNSDEYHAFLLSASGFSFTPVISHTGLVISGYENNAIGTLKSTTDGSKLVAAHAFDNDVIELMDFDKTTGAITNPVVFSPNATPHANNFIGVYGAEFSPSNKYLYVSANNSLTEPSVLYQFDISVANSASILASKQVIAKTSPWNAGALQLGPDKKIYMTMQKDTALSVISNPEAAGAACNFEFNKIRVPGREPLEFGLPTFVQSTLDDNFGPHDFTRSGGDCASLNVQFNLSRNTGLDSVRWDFGDLQQSTVLSPSHLYSAPGFYDVKLIVFKKDCSGVNNDTISRNIWIAAGSNLLRGDTSTCDNISLRIGINAVAGASYLWSDGSVTDSITVSAIGRYWVRLERSGCILSDTFNVLEKNHPAVLHKPDTSICMGKQVVLDGGNNINPATTTYQWSTGETTRYITVSTIGKYKVKLTLDGCSSYDSLAVNWGDCELFIPNAFTPNNDGWNDAFGVASGLTVQSFSLQVYNKYGQVIFITRNVTDKWDGTYKGKPVPNGAYVYQLSYTTLRGIRDFMQGTVMLIR